MTKRKEPKVEHHIHDHCQHCLHACGACDLAYCCKEGCKKEWRNCHMTHWWTYPYYPNTTAIYSASSGYVGTSTYAPSPSTPTAHAHGH